MLDIGSLANCAMQSRLAKDKSGLADLGDVQRYLASVDSKSGDPTSIYGKAQNRILASKVLLQDINQVLNRLRAYSGLTAESILKPATSEKRDTKGKTRARKELVDMDGNFDRSLPVHAGQLVASNNDACQGFSSRTKFGGEDAAIEDNDSYLPADEDASSDDGDADDWADRTNSSGSGSDKDDSIFFDSASSSCSASKENLAKKQKAASVPLLKSSAFLPSLAGGYTLGDSDGSVYSISDEEGAGSAKVERKNRRGQRARQA